MSDKFLDENQIQSINLKIRAHSTQWVAATPQIDRTKAR
jgi:hypothetical protein